MIAFINARFSKFGLVFEQIEKERKYQLSLSSQYSFELF